MIVDVPENRPVRGAAPAAITTKVALVEDSAPLRRQLKHMLSRAPGIKCVCDCGSAEEAFQKIPAAAPDVVLMDINLPGVSGIGCAAKLKLQMPGLQVIMLTVYEDGDSIFNALKAGACGYLLKRSSPAEILDAVMAVRQGGVPMTGEIARKVIMTFQSPVARSGSGDSFVSRTGNSRASFPRFIEQGNRGQTFHQLSHRESSSEARLRQTPRPLAR